MCLDKAVTQIVAIKDIVCYKVLLNYGGENYRTPYRGMIVDMNTVYIGNLDPYPNLSDVVNVGFHSYCRLSDAYRERNYLQPGSVIAKCIIPMHAHYYTGWFDDSPAYASDVIKYLKILR
jgi:hypothetical protein